MLPYSKSRLATVSVPPFLMVGSLCLAVTGLSTPLLPQNPPFRAVLIPAFLMMLSAVAGVGVAGLGTWRANRKKETLQEELRRLKASEQALRERDDIHAAMFEAVPDLVFICQQEGTILQANRCAVETLQCAREDLVGSRISDWEASSNSSCVEVWTRWESDDPIALRGELRRSDGGLFPIEMRAVRVRPGAGETALWIVMARDVSERRASEAALLAEQGERGRMEGVLQTVRTLQHEVNNPLQSLMGALELMERKHTQCANYPKCALRYFDWAFGSARQIQAVVSQLGEAAREASAPTVASPAGAMLSLSPAETLSPQSGPDEASTGKDLL